MTSREGLGTPRRIWLRAVLGVAVAAPLGLIGTRVGAVQNGPTRGLFKYQDSPSGGKDCAGCSEFVPGKTPKDRGGCTVIPGDDEISPNGWCVMWEKKK